MLAKQHQYRSSFTTLGTGRCEMGIIMVGHRPLYAYTVCVPNVTTCDKICRPSPPYLHTATNQMLGLHTSLASLQVEAKLSVMLKNKDSAILVASNLLPFTDPTLETAG